MEVLPICLSGFPTSFFLYVRQPAAIHQYKRRTWIRIGQSGYALGMRPALQDRGKRACILTTSVKKRKVHPALALKDANFSRVSCARRRILSIICIYSVRYNY